MKVFLSICFSFLFLFAQEPLSLDRAIQKVKEKNREIDIAKMDELLKTLDAQIASASHYGALDFAHNALRSNDALNVFGYKLQSREATFADFGFKQLDMSNPNYQSTPSDLNEPQDRNHFSTTLTYTLPLYTGGKITQHEKITKALRYLSSLSKEEVRLQKIYEVKKSFYDIALMQAYRVDLEEIEKTMQRMLETTHAFMDEGYAKKVDILEVEARLAHVQRQLISTKANTQLLYHYLSFLLDEPVTHIVTQEHDGLDFELNDAQILHDNLSVKKAEQAVEIAKMNIALQESAYLPQIGAFAQYGSADNRWMGEWSQNDAYTVGVQMKWNLFNGGADRASIEKARVGHLKAAQELVLSQKSLLLHVKQLQTKQITYAQEVLSLKKEVALLDVIYENYVARYAQRLASINDVMLKHSDLLQTKLKLKEAQNAYYEIIFELEKIASKDEV
ncbi:TolC family protein [Sulfurospirillum deleyianum]|uniref:Outer membrane efflux protein n=1 Tax=Sulfurospirillum deleyianum (strain ATCC 51133 / DSM 6946 / 5175) TaxID=525898 RepID=D1B036_SULD5|nr:TolC family protein [Sulfurospirillum deleyianum]ACZ11653.1 outer membrane efflux protein [Sulfurospirillum deleyianum DSM 6946]